MLAPSWFSRGKLVAADGHVLPAHFRNANAQFEQMGIFVSRGTTEVVRNMYSDVCGDNEKSCFIFYHMFLSSKDFKIK